MDEASTRQTAPNKRQLPEPRPLPDTGRLVLGLDAATPPASVALVRGDTLLAHAEGPFGRGTDGWILEAVHQVLTEADVALADLDLVAASRGPGTFTGVRVALSLAHGLAIGAGIRATGVPTLTALLADANFPALLARPTIALIDARRSQLYAAGARLTAPPSADLQPDWGPAALTLQQALEVCGDLDQAHVVAPAAIAGWAATPDSTTPSGLAASVARVAARTAADRLVDAVPEYLRPPDAVRGRSPLREASAGPLGPPARR